MCNYIMAASGNIFILTDLGKQTPKISVKFEPDYIHKDTYKHSVPEKWVRMGYVTEVKDK